MEENELSNEVIGAAIEVHRHLGVGLLESAYEHALAIELEQRGVAYQRQLALPASYKGIALNDAYRLDLLVGGLVIVEIKAIASVGPIHSAQLLTYLRLSGLRLGLLLNFNSDSMRAGIKRVVNHL
ncbi:MAG: GxxExxY protein [Panacagrimonas sp.]